MNKYLDEYGNVLEYSRDSPTVHQSVDDYFRNYCEALLRQEQERYLIRKEKERQQEFKFE